MARRVLKPLTPLLVGLVALVLGFLAIGPSFADSEAPIPSSSTSTVAPDSVAPTAAPTQSALPEEMIPTGAPTSKPPKPPKAPKTVDPGPMACASCMAPPGS
jgi:hypothetical protein